MDWARFEQLCALEIVADERRVEFTRSSAPFHDVEELREFWREAIEQVTGSVSGAWGILSDLRNAKGRNDAAFEQEMSSARRPLYRRFQRSAVVVGTVVGRMHVTRSTSEDGVTTRIFDDLEAARAWLREELPSD